MEKGVGILAVYKSAQQRMFGESQGSREVKLSGEVKANDKPSSTGSWGPRPGEVLPWVAVIGGRLGIARWRCGSM